MLEFILNDRLVSTTKPSGSLLLDFIRYDKQLTGTKIGCREGDCGACTVLIGEIVGEDMHYTNVTSCLTPIGNVAGKHVVTVEGLNMSKLSPVQQAIVDEGGTQCGFCTVGFVVSLTGFCIENQQASYSEAIAAIDGNICRCTGYKSLERAAARLVELLQNQDKNAPIRWLVEHDYLPDYFLTVPDRLRKIQPQEVMLNGKMHVGGGTDLYVQQHDSLIELDVTHLFNRQALKGIAVQNGLCTIGAGTTVAEFANHSDIQALFPNLRKHMKLVSSSPIRNISTIAGNFVNASPIGDMTAFFLALDASIVLKGNDGTRTMYLKDFYKGYKTLDKKEEEIIQSIFFSIPTGNSHFNFEKVSKRTHLDIASVNTALCISLHDDFITDVHVSAGGIGPIPTYLFNTRAALLGKKVSQEVVTEAQLAMQEEISPISDVRGTASYKRLLLQQLFFAHFLTLFPNQLTLEELV
ncbi:MAG: FAD binding domain-containing protein [Flammeovirgaceae bacterium]